MKTLYLIRGVPGSGKSNLAKKLVDSGCVIDVFEVDQYFTKADGTYVFNPALLGEVHEACKARTEFVLGKGYSVAVSNTSTTEKEVQAYKDIAERCNAQFVSIIVENRHEGKNQHSVPDEKIQQMKNRFSVKL